MSGSRRLRTYIFPAVALVAALVVVAALLFVNREGARSDPNAASAGRAAKSHTTAEPSNRESDKQASGSAKLSEVLKEHSALASHRLPLAYVSEKLDQQGGEASGEIVNGPAQEQYAQRAYPRTTIDASRQDVAARAFVQARLRSQTAAGRQLLRKAQGVAKARSWTALGPRGGLQLPNVGYTGDKAIVSGRTTSLAIGNTCTRRSCVLYVGTAGGGVWKTTNALAGSPRWRPIGSGIPSNAIGVVYIAPNGDLYVGTGEPNGSGDSEAGVGLYRSTNGGTSFTKVPTVAHGVNFTVSRSIASIAMDPNNPAHMYVGTAVARHGSSSANGGRFTPPGAAKVGVYETTDAGKTWHKSLLRISDTVDPSTPTGSDYFRGGITKILFDPAHPKFVYASMFDYGLYRRLGRGAWKPIYKIHTAGHVTTELDSRVEYALATLPNGHTRIYLGDATYFGNAVAGFQAALLRTNNGTGASPSWRLLSSPTEGTPGYGSYNFCQAQCSYDMVVSSPAGRPNQVFLSGSMNYAELAVFGGPGDSNGRAVVRSVDAGRHFTDMTNDARSEQTGLHPDHHALVFVPHTRGRMFFTGSDGGVVRQRGPFVNRSRQCARRGLSGAQLRDCRQFLSAIPTKNASVNSGLATLQYQSVSVAPNGITLQGGTQDNGTWEKDTRHDWAETIGGDGGQSAFNTANQRIRYHSYYLPIHDVSFDGGSPTSWDFISDPLLGSGEAASFYVPFIADPVVAGTVFDGLQHIWRTPDNGGKRAYLDKHCNELTGDFANGTTCGDWKPLGGKAGDLSRGNPDDYVVAIERAPSNTSTMWAATRTGHLFLSRNANTANPAAVTYQRLDRRLGLPQRFVSGIAIDPANPYHVFLSYSGYSAYSPGGHVFDVRWHPKTNTATVRNLSLDLGDQPVTDIVYVPSTKALFISTDFGVLTRPRGGGSWVATPGLPKVAVYGLTLSQRTGNLFAATHGRSIWRLHVG